MLDGGSGVAGGHPEYPPVAPLASHAKVIVTVGSAVFMADFGRSAT